ncbi:hypothetical protein NVIRENTERO_04115 [Sodalis praecaptivus]|nr:hypothetical protein NVIRENTERO_04115 [Sodalis praecaptivus]
MVSQTTASIRVMRVLRCFTLQPQNRLIKVTYETCDEAGHDVPDARVARADPNFACAPIVSWPGSYLQRSRKKTWTSGPFQSAKQRYCQGGPLWRIR